jgi:hypothetical protein
MHMPTRCVALAVAMTALASTGRAQHAATQPEMIPRVLVRMATGALDPVGRSGPLFTIGRPPEGWPAHLVPSATIVGGSTYGVIRSLVFRFPRTRDGEAAFVAQLTRAGFHRPDTTHSRGEGFAAGRGSARIEGSSYCSDSSGAVMVVPIDSTTSTRSVGVLFLAGPGTYMTGCANSPERARTFMRPNPALRIPLLRAPVGAVISPGGMSSSGSSFDVRVEADTALSATALVTHYAREFVRGGWILADASTGTRRAALQSLSARDSTGAVWQGALTIYTIGDRRRMHLMMAHPDER